MKQIDAFTRLIEPGSWFFSYLDGWHQLNVGARPLNEQYEYLTDRGLSQLRFAFDTLFGHSPRDLSFLERFSGAEAVSIGGNFHDFTPLESLTNLKSFHDRAASRKGMCFDQIYSVEDLRVDYESAHPKYENFVNLLCFDVARLPKRFADFSRFEFKQVKELSIASSPTRSLSGIEGFRDLEKLALHRCRTLEGSILDGICENVQKLRLEYCPNLKSVAFLEHLPNLRELTLVRCGTLVSFEPVLQLSHLDKLVVEATDFQDFDKHKIEKELNSINHLAVI